MTVELCKKYTITIEPGDIICLPDLTDRVVMKVVQTLTNQYVVTNDGCWRPFSTYGETWWLVDEEDW